MSSSNTTRETPSVRGARRGAPQRRQRMGRTAPGQRVGQKPPRGKAVGGALAQVRGADPAALLARFKVPLVVAAVVLVLFVALYGPACNVYQQWRIEGARKYTLAELDESNSSYQDDIDRLQTREGIEDEARRRGYVSEGEKTLVVEGLEGEDSEDTPTEDTAPEKPWYLGITDFIFQYSEE